MNNLSLKQKIIGIITVIGIILILIFQGGLYSKSTASVEKLEDKTTTTQSENPEVASTNPSPLEKAIIWGMQPIEITFNLPIENIPELKYKLEPEADMKVELLNDKKTIRFTPNKPLPLGVSFTLTIPSEAKFDGKKTLGQDYQVHFKTIEYKGV
jgi:hypothetical protein